MKTKFRHPPINELVIGLYFDRHLPLRSEHVGLFWSSVRSDFPVIRQQPMISPPVLGAVPAITVELVGPEEVYPMPRFWLESQDGMLMQVQKNAFLLNWRKGASDYPHYETVKASFDRNFVRFARFIDDEFQTKPTLQIAELSYINTIESCDYWSGPKDTANVFPLFRIVLCPEAPESQQPNFNHIATHQFSSDLSLSIAIRNGRLQTDGGKPVLIFEFRALGLLGASDKPEADLWFARAHEAIGDCFMAITNPDIQQQYWQPK